MQDGGQSLSREDEETVFMASKEPILIDRSDLSLTSTRDYAPGSAVDPTESLEGGVVSERVASSATSAPIADRRSVRAGAVFDTELGSATPDDDCATHVDDDLQAASAVDELSSTSVNDQDDGAASALDQLSGTMETDPDAKAAIALDELSSTVETDQDPRAASALYQLSGTAVNDQESKAASALDQLFSTVETDPDATFTAQTAFVGAFANLQGADALSADEIERAKDAAVKPGPIEQLEQDSASNTPGMETELEAPGFAGSSFASVPSSDASDVPRSNSNTRKSASAEIDGDTAILSPPDRPAQNRARRGGRGSMPAVKRSSSRRAGSAVPEVLTTDGAYATSYEAYSTSGSPSRGQQKSQVTIDTVCETIDDGDNPNLTGMNSGDSYSSDSITATVSVTMPRRSLSSYDYEEDVLPADPLEEARYDRPTRRPRPGRTSWQGGAGGSGGGRSGLPPTGGDGGGSGGGVPSASMLMFCVLLSILLPMWYFVHLIISRPEWVVEKVSKVVKMGVSFGSQRLRLLREMKRNKVVQQRRVTYRTLVVRLVGQHIVARCVPRQRFLYSRNICQHVNIIRGKSYINLTFTKKNYAKNVHFHYLNKSFLDQSMQQLFCLTLKTAALPVPCCVPCERRRRSPFDQKKQRCPAVKVVPDRKTSHCTVSVYNTTI